MRYELNDHEWAAIKPFLPNKPRGVPRVSDMVRSLELAARRGYPPPFPWVPPPPPRKAVDGGRHPPGPSDRETAPVATAAARPYNR